MRLLAWVFETVIDSPQKTGLRFTCWLLYATTMLFNSCWINSLRKPFSIVSIGSEPGFYRWCRGVRMRANLDLLLGWAQETGLGELALEHTQTVSSAINLLATPRKNLLQVKHFSLHFSWHPPPPTYTHTQFIYPAINIHQTQQTENFRKADLCRVDERRYLCLYADVLDVAAVWPPRPESGSA